MPALRPVVDSEGGEYESIAEAAFAMWVQPSTMHVALQATKCGRYHAIEGLQWAYADGVPEVWPSGVDQREPRLCPANWRGYCSYRDQKED
jgi:hypothetical protein